jgi:hypothetical protein
MCYGRACRSGRLWRWPGSGRVSRVVPVAWSVISPIIALHASPSLGRFDIKKNFGQALHDPPFHCAMLGKSAAWATSFALCCCRRVAHACVVRPLGASMHACQAVGDNGDDHHSTWVSVRHISTWVLLTSQLYTVPICWWMLKRTKGQYCPY